MGSVRLPRKLAAILYADVAGYSRLTGEDEDATHRRLSEYLDLISVTVEQHRGRIMHYAGDAVLAMFDAAVDALACAASLQQDLKSRNQELPDERKVEFRIGVNLGDVIEDRGDIYGDGVNVAARLEGLAKPGGICVSESVRLAVGKKLPLDYDFMGEQEVKNITEPVRAYHAELTDGAELLTPQYIASATALPTRSKRVVVMIAGLVVLLIAVGSLIYWHPWEPGAGARFFGHSTLALPDKPSIVVLPFANMSGDPEQEYFADGMTDDLITDLSKISGIFIIARNSAFTYKGKNVDVQAVGKELGVKYVLEGSVRRAGDQVRINAQLVDARSGGHLWAERYDRGLKDVFALQDEVTQKIVGALAVTLTEDEQERLMRKYTDNIEAYDYYLRGWEYFSDPTREANVLARQMHEKAVDLDPKFAAAYALLSFTYSQEWSMGWSQDPRSLEVAFELAKMAIALDESLPLGYSILGEVNLWKKDHDKAIAAQEKAISLSPNGADQIAGLGGILIWTGRPDKTLELVKKAMRLNPMYPIEYLWNLGHANFVLGRHEEAIEALKKIRDRNPNYLPARAYLTASYSELGWDEEARTEAAEFKRLSPRTSIEAWRERLPYKDKAVLERVLSSLRKAGLK